MWPRAAFVRGLPRARPLRPQPRVRQRRRVSGDRDVPLLRYPLCRSARAAGLSDPLMYTRPVSPTLLDPNPTIGECIYCRSRGPELTTEHIVPKGLLPRSVEPWLLYEASCPTCSALTSAFERTVLKGVWSPIRAALDLSSYRRKKRPKMFPIRIKRGDGIEEFMVPASDYPAMLVLPVFQPPAYLERRPYQDGVQVRGVHMVQCTTSDPRDAAGKYGGALGVQGTLDTAAFARLLLKVAYGFVVGRLGLGAIEEAYVLDTILGRTRDFSRWLGNDSQMILDQTSFHTAACNIFEPRDIIVRVRLFGAPAPEYVTVVGRATEAATVSWTAAS